MAKLLLSVPEAAEALSISRAKLYRLMGDGEIPYLHIDRSRRIPLSALENYVSDLLAKERAA
ncbi:helix-turn-helix domain-containing protein [Sphaerisporangium sp. NPDC005289]|uniref:helix-turn-helix domain-containing protein n=1 Tax=Sphaerisporangium sp. NPDC005289 TaxID=3155247 RepID=UPI0033A8D3D1